MINKFFAPTRPASGIAIGLIAATFLTGAKSFAADLDTIGVTALRAATTNLNGSGVRVAQAEAELNSSTPPPFEVNPMVVGLPAADFTYYEGPPVTVLASSASGYPNSVGSESSHGDAVGGAFYGFPSGVSTNISHVDNYEGNYFLNTVVPELTAINDPVVNQSFAASGLTTNQQETYDSYYDKYSAQFGTLFVSGVGDSGPVSLPSTSYNGIGVGAYQGTSSVGPTLDNGRAKPDVTAPADATSYSTPLVAGAATILLQAGSRGDGGSDTTSATDQRMIKALLLNGAVKPADWANPSPSPLDPRYGSGILDVYNSYRQLAGGKHTFIQSGSVVLGAAHPALGGAGNVAGTNGWDFDTISSTPVTDGVNHYYFQLGGGTAGAASTGTMTLVWNRQFGQTAINNLDLFLYNVASGALIGASTSVVDNVEHIYLPSLPPGRYDLQVLKHGGNTVSPSETYALAFEFFTTSLAITVSGSNVQLTWPTYPDGFQLESTGNLTPPASWSASPTPVISGQQNVVTLDASGASQFFRLARP